MPPGIFGSARAARKRSRLVWRFPPKAPRTAQKPRHCLWHFPPSLLFLRQGANYNGTFHACSAVVRPRFWSDPRELYFPVRADERGSPACATLHSTQGEPASFIRRVYSGQNRLFSTAHLPDFSFKLLNRQSPTCLAGRRIARRQSGSLGHF